MSVLSSAPTPPQRRMSPRARIYMAIVALQHMALGLALILRPDDFRSGSYEGMRVVLAILVPPGDALGWSRTTMMLWGVAFVVIGLSATRAAITQNTSHARDALGASVVIAAIWVGMFLYAGLEGTLAGWSGPIVWAGFGARDAVQIVEPMRNALEDVVGPEPKTRRRRLFWKR